MPLKVATLNLLSDLSYWDQRSPILAGGLAAVGADLLAFQEVNLEKNTATWLAEKLGYPYVYLTPKTGRAGKSEAIAILSRLPFEKTAQLDLGSQNRVAQFASFNLGNQRIGLANGHFYWQPGESEGRQHQVRLLLEWLEPLQEDQPIVVCGDFNAGPGDAAVKQMLTRFRSAYAEIHGREPDYTWPTQLPRSKLSLLSTLIAFWREIRLNEIRLDWHTTLDYIFVDSRIRIQNCVLIFDKPASEDSKLYASDHFGLLASLDF